MELETRVRRIIDQYVVSFKRRHSGRLLNILVDATSIIEASQRAQAYVREHVVHRTKGYNEYGISPSTTVEMAVVSWGRNGREVRWYPAVLRRGKLKLIEAHWMYPGVA